MSVVNLTEKNFSELLGKKEGILLVDFWAPWCGPCRTFGPVFEAAADKHTDLTFAKLNTEDQGGIAKSLSIQSIPTLMVLRDGILVHRQAGVLPAKALEKLIDAVRDLDMDEVRAKAKKAKAKAASTDAGATA